MPTAFDGAAPELAQPNQQQQPPLPAGDAYHAMAAAANVVAAGYPLNVPFMYPHVDASNVSTAATGGGSENNESVNSLESSSNKGGSARPSSAHFQQQQQQQQAQQPQPDVAPRGFTQPGMGEYPNAATAQYGWPVPPGDFVKAYQQQHQQQLQQPGGPYGGYAHYQQHPQHPQHSQHLQQQPG
ncbi:hypothetical protein EC988_009740, partial [Linderina pennispora]